MVSLKSAAILTTMVGMIVIGGEAAAETVETGCLSKPTGEIYALAPYRSAPSKKCREGEPTVRVSLHQPSTAFAKRSRTINSNSATEMAEFDQILIMLRSDGGLCELVVDDPIQATEHVVVSVPAGSWQEGLREVTRVDHELPGSETFEAHRLIPTDRGGAFVFHDVFVDHRQVEGQCFATFLVEYAEDLQHLYDR
jgi:hypothetical protein